MSTKLSSQTFLHEKNDLIRLDNVTLGRDIKIYSFVNLYGCSIGDQSKIGTFVEIQKNSSIGKRCKISSHTFICEGVQIGDDVFIGHGVMFINDKYPKASKNKIPLQENDWTLLKTVVEDEVSIGSNATILCGVRIGYGATIGAGAVVTKDISPHSVVVGNPAQTLVRNLRVS